MRVLYLGSPAFAVAPLEALAAAGYEIVAVVTQPDRPAGRKRTLTAPPVKLAAQQRGLSVLQPESLRDPDIAAHLTALAPDVGVVAAYGEILRRDILDIPPLGYLNIHPSLLPLHRGPAPVAGAILAGDSETGVSIMKLDTRMDSGPLLAQAVIPLADTARTAPLTQELFHLGSRLLLEVLPRYAAGELEPRPQDHSQASYTQLLKKTDGAIDWTLPAVVIERMTRAYDPWPGAFTTWHGQQIKVIAAQVHASAAPAEAPGTILRSDDHLTQLQVATGSGMLELLELQPAGKRPMTGHAWLMGHPDAVGQHFGAM